MAGYPHGRYPWEHSDEELTQEQKEELIYDISKQSAQRASLMADLLGYDKWVEIIHKFNPKNKQF